MKKLISLMVMGLFVLAQAAPAGAVTNTTTFTLTALMPAASGSNIAAYKYPGGTLVSGTALDFGTLAIPQGSTFGSFLASNYYAITVTPASGGGSPTTTVTYTEGNNPNSATGGHGLGYKSNITFMKVIGVVETQAGSHVPQTLQVTTTAVTITPADLTAGGVTGYLKMYVAVADGSNTASNPGEPFTALDASGTYGGTVVVSATI